MRIIFFGSDPWFSPPVLEAVLKAGHEVTAAVTKGDALKNFRFKISDLRFVEARTEDDITRERLNSLIRPGLAAPARPGLSRPDVIILAAFGPPFLSTEVLNWPKYGCLNVHASLLPRWRGASPVFGALENGDKETGVSIMRMTKRIDLGPVLGQVGLKVSDFDTRETLTKRLGILGGKLIVETLKKLQNGQINEVKQPPKSPTPYTHRLTKDSGRIDWSRSPIQIERFIRAAFPWPCAMSNIKFKIKNEKWQTIQNVKILKAHLEKLPRRDCRGRRRRPRNDVALVIDLLQLPGKNPISWKQFLAGHPNAILVHGSKKSKSRQ